MALLSPAMLRRILPRLHRRCRYPITNMSPLTYASVVSRNQSHAATAQASQPSQPASEPEEGHRITKHLSSKSRSPSPSPVPNTKADDENVYVLTIRTDDVHHRTMTELRNRYFPKKLNKLNAHLTLFHALPESKLESTIIPAIEHLVKEHAPFSFHARFPFRLTRGIAIAIPKSRGHKQIQSIRHNLLKPWRDEGFLSEQDAGRAKPHYTIMNKVDNEEDVAKAFEEVKNWKGHWGMAEGLALFRYHRRFWIPKKTFLFTGQEKVADGPDSTARSREKKNTTAPR